VKIILCIPVLNAEARLPALLAAIKTQTVQPDEFWVINSTSTDKSVEILRDARVNVHIIPRSEFNHGGTRHLFLSLTQGDIYIYLTDDAIPASPQTFESILSVFKRDSLTGLAYGRQLPYPNATPFSAHARLFNYPETSFSKTLSDSKKLGIKTPFCSDSFSAYRREVLEGVGGFPNHVIMAEDVYTAAKILQKGWKVSYVAEAAVYHSHNYSVSQEFKRYFDIGVFYGKEKWIQNTFGKAGAEGKRFLYSELNYLKRNKEHFLFPEWFFRNLMKWLGYQLGQREKWIPLFIKKRLSMCRKYWE